MRKYNNDTSTSRNWHLFCLIFATFAVLMFYGCDSEIKKPELTMNSGEVVHALAQVATMNAMLEVSDVSVYDSLSQHYKNEISRVTQRDYEEIIYNISLLETMPDTLIVLQTRALDTLRKLQNKLVYKRDVD